MHITLSRDHPAQNRSIRRNCNYHRKFVDFSLVRNRIFTSIRQLFSINLNLFAYYYYLNKSICIHTGCWCQLITYFLITTLRFSFVVQNRRYNENGTSMMKRERVNEKEKGNKWKREREWQRNDTVVKRCTCTYIAYRKFNDNDHHIHSHIYTYVYICYIWYTPFAHLHTHIYAHKFRVQRLESVAHRQNELHRGYWMTWRRIGNNVRVSNSTCEAKKMSSINL